MAAIFDEERVFRGWSRDGHGGEDLAGSITLSAEDLTHEVGAHAMSMKQLGASYARLKERSRAQLDGSPRLLLDCKGRDQWRSLPSVVASWTCP